MWAVAEGCGEYCTVLVAGGHVMLTVLMAWQAITHIYKHIQTVYRRQERSMQT